MAFEQAGHATRLRVADAARAPATLLRVRSTSRRVGRNGSLTGYSSSWGDALVTAPIGPRSVTIVRMSLTTEIQAVAETSRTGRPVATAAVSSAAASMSSSRHGRRPVGPGDGNGAPRS
jgi:hypothetical protein